MRVGLWQLWHNFWPAFDKKNITQVQCTVTVQNAQWLRKMILEHIQVKIYLKFKYPGGQLSAVILLIFLTWLKCQLPWLKLEFYNFHNWYSFLFAKNQDIIKSTDQGKLNLVIKLWKFNSWRKLEFKFSSTCAKYMIRILVRIIFLIIQGQRKDFSGGLHGNYL